MAKKKDPKDAFQAAYNRKKERLKQELDQKTQETDKRISELEQEAKIAKLTAKVANTQDSQPQPLTPFEVLQRRQQREAEK